MLVVASCSMPRFPKLGSNYPAIVVSDWGYPSNTMDVVLVAGSMLCIGRSNYYRFNHPEEAELMKTILPNARISSVPLHFANAEPPGNRFDSIWPRIFFYFTANRQPCNGHRTCLRSFSTFLEAQLGTWLAHGTELSPSLFSFCAALLPSLPSFTKLSFVFHNVTKFSVLWLGFTESFLVWSMITKLYWYLPSFT